jgi:hypothetical protein
MTLAHFDDDHPRVRYAAIHTIAQLSTDFQVSQFLILNSHKFKKLTTQKSFQR